MLRTNSEHTPLKWREQMNETLTPSLVDLTVAEFTGLVASQRPLPGGGSAAALAGALGAALAAMVARLTVDRPRYTEHAAQMAAIRDGADALRSRLLGLVDADARTYQGVMAAYQLPKATVSQVARRTGAIQTALRRAAELPLETAGLCLEALELAGTVAAHGNRNAASDAAVGALLAHAGLQGAAFSARANLALIHDAHFREKMGRRASEMLAAGEAALANALAAANAGT